MQKLIEAVWECRTDFNLFLSKIRNSAELRYFIQLWSFETEERKLRYKWAGYYLMAWDFYSEVKKEINKRLSEKIIDGGS